MLQLFLSKGNNLLSQTLNLVGVVTCLHNASGTVLAPSLDLTDFYASAVPLRTLLPLWGQLQVNILNNGKLISRWCHHSLHPDTWESQARGSRQPAVDHRCLWELHWASSWVCTWRTIQPTCKPWTFGLTSWASETWCGLCAAKALIDLQKVIGTRHSCAQRVLHTWNSSGR